MFKVLQVCLCIFKGLLWAFPFTLRIYKTPLISGLVDYFHSLNLLAIIDDLSNKEEKID